MKIRGIYRIIIIMSLLLFSFSLFAVSPPQKTIRKVYKLLGKYDENAKGAYKTKKEINKYFALNKMARNAIVDHWHKLRRRQKREYMRLMYKLLERSVYRDTSDNLRKGKVSFLGQNKRTVKATVFTKIYLIDDDMEVENDFIMRKSTRWIVHDLLIDKASLTQDYRSQFNEIVSKDGFDKNKDSLFPRLRSAVSKKKEIRTKTNQYKRNKTKKKKRKVSILEGV